MVKYRVRYKVYVTETIIIIKQFKAVNRIISNDCGFHFPATLTM